MTYTALHTFGRVATLQRARLTNWRPNRPLFVTTLLEESLYYDVRAARFQVSFKIMTTNYSMSYENRLYLSDLKNSQNKQKVPNLLDIFYLDFVDDPPMLSIIRVEADGELAQDFKDRKSTRLNSSHSGESRMPSSA